jgi:hypothetical protein
MPVAKVHFLSGADVDVEVPPAYDPTPEMTSTVRLDGARSIVYRPFSAWEPPPERNPLLVEQFVVHTGYTQVTVYRSREEPPPTLVAFWRLPNGYLNTFMQDDYECGADIEGRLRTVIDNLVVRISRRGLPIISLRPPLQVGDPSEWLQRDQIQFLPRDRGDVASTLALIKDPVWTPEGSASRVDGPTAAGFATGATHVTVRVNGLADQRAALKQEAERISATVRLGG